MREGRPEVVSSNESPFHVESAGRSMQGCSYAQADGFTLIEPFDSGCALAQDRLLREPTPTQRSCNARYWLASLARSSACW